MRPGSSIAALGLATMLGAALPARAQTPAPPTAAFPPDPPTPTPAPSPNAPPPSSPAPSASATAAPAPPTATATTQGAAMPPPLPPPAGVTSPTYPAPANREAPPPPPTVYEPPPPAPPAEKSTFPDISIRVDPFNLLLEGQLGIELEVAILKFLSAELVPLFVVNDSPPTFGYVTGREETVTRASNGLGPLAGTSIDVGLWPQGKPLKGYVVRAIFTNYSYRYEAWDLAPTPFDRVDHVERRLFIYLGSHSRWGPFTMAGGFGIGGELNSERRCFVNDASGVAVPTENCTKKELLIKLERNPLPVQLLPVGDLYGGLGGVQLLVRFSLGVVF